MRNEIPLLQNVRVAAPCPAAWNEMAEVEGNRVKFCSGCQKRVYNLSAMGQAEAEGLLRRHEGHLCVRYYRRRDGTILTTDCPVGLKAARTLAFRRAQVSFAACLLFCVGFAAYRASELSVTMGIPASYPTEQSVDANPSGEDEVMDNGWVGGYVFTDVEPIRIATGGVPPPNALKKQQAAHKSSRKTKKHE
jgi:hypothetical protein